MVQLQQFFAQNRKVKKAYCCHNVEAIIVRNRATPRNGVKTMTLSQRRIGWRRINVVMFLMSGSKVR